MPVAGKHSQSPDPNALELIPPHILVVDDERQIHSSLRLRLASQYRLTFASDPREALSAIGCHQFDLCVVDVHMPEMDGLTLIEAARKLDSALGFVVLTGHDSDENLRRVIPLQVLDLIAKPLLDKTRFEHRIADWVTRTRARRQEVAVVQGADTLMQDLEVARIERDVELTASASAREALLQTSSLLTTTQALLFNVQHMLDSLPRDPRLTGIQRSIGEARRHADSASAIAEGYFGSAYADRESSPALVDTSLRHAISITQRTAKAQERQQRIDLHPLQRDVMLADLSGIDFLLMLVPLLALSLELAAPGSTIQIRCGELTRLDRILEDPLLKRCLWVNRRHALGGNPGISISVRSNAPALQPDLTTAWLRGEPKAAWRYPSRGLIRGVQMSKGLLGIATQPEAARFAVVLCLRLMT